MNFDNYAALCKSLQQTRSKVKKMVSATPSFLKGTGLLKEDIMRLAVVIRPLPSILQTYTN